MNCGLQNSAKVKIMSGTLVELDGCRLSIAKIATHDRYLVREEADGVLNLESATVITAAEARQDQQTELSAQFVESLEHPEHAVPRRHLA